VVAAAAAVAAVVAGAAVLLLGGGDGDQQAEAPRTNSIAPPANAERPRTTTAPLSRADTTVAVLNGTTIPGLAARTAEKLKQSGYDMGTVADAAEQNRSATVVQYVPGAQRQAAVIAGILGVGQDAIDRLDTDTQTVAGDDADVVVTVGADQSADTQS
jgi:hypothetical protein